MDLNNYSSGGFCRGASKFKEALWMVINKFFFSSWLPGSHWRVILLRAFGGHLGNGVVIKPSVHIKFPWKLRVGDFCWLGEKVWIDNLDFVTIGSNVCISQGVYICTGSHDWSSSNFDLITRPVVIEDKVWLGAFSKVAPGAFVSKGVVVSMGGVVKGKLSPWRVYACPVVSDSFERRLDSN